MKFLRACLFLAGLCLLAFGAKAQDKPVELTKKELPKRALCVICSARGSSEGEEKPVSGVRFKGVSYFFCSGKEADEFKKDPESWVPLPLPRPAPKFNLKTLAGSEVSLESLKGKVLLVDFWATWCKPCIEGMPELQKLHDLYSEKGLTVLGVSIDEKGEKAVKPFISKKKFSYPIAIDTVEKPMWQAFRVKGIPALFLIDGEGRIVRQWLGKPDKKEVAKAVLQLLESLTPKP